jgi:ABC-type Fe3+-siderophore transport system permease subunit
MTDRKEKFGPALLALILTMIAGGLVIPVVREPLTALLRTPAGAKGYDVERMVFIYATLPRLAMAALCGAGLAGAGAIMQFVLRNPLASPTTLGVEAGARVALAIATVAAPGLLGFGRDLVAISGSAITAGLVFLLVRRRGFEPVATVIAGLIVGLFCGALAALLGLVEARQMTAVFLWGSGSLSQQSWSPFAGLALRLGLASLALLPLLRSLAVLQLGDEGARGLGLSVARLRFFAIAIASTITAFVVSTVGVIGFVGLVAPAVARLAGARRLGTQLGWSILLGALMLLITDAAVQLVAGQLSEFLPTGAVTAVLGSPLLLLLIRRMKPSTPPIIATPPIWGNPPTARAPLVLIGLGLLVVIALLVGRGPTGDWSLPFGAWGAVAVWRLPRILASGAAGALLALSGVVLQRLTRNELASPEVLGVSAGALLAVALSLLIFGEIGVAGDAVTAVCGGMVVLLLILALGRRSGFAPDHMLLAGIAVSALADALVGVLTAVGDPRAMRLLGWMSGSVAGVSLEAAVLTMAAALVTLIAALVLARWLEILPLGPEAARALGVHLPRARLSLLLLAALTSAAAMPILGPITFIGLVAPHIVMTMGLRKLRSVLYAATGTGAAIMIGADWLARTVSFPLELPTGLVAALLGAPALMLLLNRRGRG